MAPIEKGVADKRFLEHLQRSRAGRILQAHLAGIAVRNEVGARDNSMQEAIDNERVFIKTMGSCLDRGKPFPCGLPAPLPKFIAILNLSGERMLVHSNSCSLIRMLCTRSTQLSPSELVNHVDAFAAHVELSRSDKGKCHVTKFVLLSLSLPWQAGTGAMFWSLSACSFDAAPDSRVVLHDRQIALTSHSPKAFAGKPVLDRTDHTIPLDDGRDMPLVTSEQVKDFCDAYACACLDPSPREDGAVDAALGAERVGPSTRLREDVMHRLVESLRAQTATDKKRHDALQAEFDDATVTNLGIIAATEVERREEATKHASAIKEVRRERDELEEQIKATSEICEALRREQARQTKAHTKMQERFEQFKRQSESKDALANSTSAKAAMQLKALEDKLAVAQRSLASAKQEASKERDKALEKLAARHAADVERAQTKLEGKKRIIDQLSENNESRNAELASLKANQVEQDEELTRWRQATADAIEAVGAAKVVADGARAEAATARDAARGAADQLAAAQAQLARLEGARRSVGVGTDAETKSTETHRCATTQTDREAPAAPVAPAAPSGVLAPAATEAATDSAPSHHETSAPTAATGTPKDATNGSVSGEVSRQATEALQRLINHLCILEHQPLPAPIYFQYPPVGFDGGMMQAAYMGAPAMHPSQAQFASTAQLPPHAMMHAHPHAGHHPGAALPASHAPFRHPTGPARPVKHPHHRAHHGASHHGASHSVAPVAKS